MYLGVLHVLRAILVLPSRIHAQRKSSALMLPVVMERGMLNQRLWHGSVGMTLGGHFFHVRPPSIHPLLLEVSMRESRSRTLCSCHCLLASRHKK